MIIPAAVPVWAVRIEPGEGSRDVEHLKQFSAGERTIAQVSGYFPLVELVIAWDIDERDDRLPGPILPSYGRLSSEGADLPRVYYGSTAKEAVEVALAAEAEQDERG